MRVVALAVLIAITSALAACGLGGDGAPGGEAVGKRDYERRFAAVQKQVGEEGVERATTSSDETIAAELRAFAQRRAAALLAALDPPEEVAAVHDELVIGLRKTAAMYDRTVAAFEAGDRQEARRLDAEAARSGSAVLAAAGDAFRSKGYAVSLPRP